MGIWTLWLHDKQFSLIWLQEGQREQAPKGTVKIKNIFIFMSLIFILIFPM